MTNKFQMIFGLTTALAAGVGGTVLVTSLQNSPGQPRSTASNQSGAADTYYTCPMHPSVESDSPGACPVCGMNLIEKSTSSTGMDPKELAAVGQVALSPTQRVLANVETTSATAEADVDEPASEVRAVGMVTYDEEGLASIPSWVDGRIERLLVKKTGAVVNKGQPVVKIYSEELLTAQQEYIVSLASTDAGLAAQTRKRLELLGMTDAQIERVRNTRQPRETVTAYAPNAGTITDLKVRQGQYVKEGTPLYDIADLSTVWVDAEVSEKNISSVREGMDVRVVADAFPGEAMHGTITFIHPVVDSDTRTVKVRVELDNADGTLKPGMYASAFFQAGSKSDAQAGSKTGADTDIMVPKSAVIRGGKTNSVYVEVDKNVFERRQVELGRETDELLVIKSGVDAGEKVAYRGGFLLDSEVQLNSFGGASGDHDQGGHGGDTSDAPKKLTDADIPADGKKFDPPIVPAQVPRGAWYCKMNAKSHWVQHQKGDGKCPVCGMFLKQKPTTDPTDNADTRETQP